MTEFIYLITGNPQEASAIFLLGILVGCVLTIFATKKELTLAQYTALLFFLFWMFLITLSTVTGFVVEIYVHAGGLACLGTLTGIKTSELLTKVLGRK